MNLLDLAAIAILAAAVALGAWAGFFPQLLGLVGAAAGFGVALIAANALNPTLAGIDQPMRAVVAASGLVALTLLGEAAGSALGSRARAAMRERLLAAVDLAGGALIGFGQGILALWLVGGLILAGAVPGLERSASDSVILGAINRVLPAPEGVAAQIVGLLAPTEFPQLFAGIEPSPAPALDLPDETTARALTASAEASTVQVLVIGCGHEQLGTGFFVTSQVVVTNAHVVAGGDTMSVAFGGDTYEARLILYDPRQDIALLRVPTASAPALRLAATSPQRGTDAGALGHPGGGPLALIPAVVTAAFDAAGPDIYGAGSVTRSIVELRADVRRGDSGGPLLTAPGVVGGVIFGASRVDAGVGYALAASSVATEIREGTNRTATVGSGACVSE
jgi:S1-C subfamily serine protease